MTRRTAACACGELTVIAHGDPVRVSVCHCLACQRRTGSVFGAQARFDKQNVATAGKSTTYVRVADSGQKVTFHFCPRCGSTVYYVLEGHEEMFAIPVGAFADPCFPPPTRSVYERRMHSWISVPSAIERIA